MDSQNDGVLANYDENKGFPFPALRLTGMKLTMEFDFRNGNNTGVEGHTGYHVCYIDVAVEKTWASKQVIAYGTPARSAVPTGDARFRYLYGVRIVFRTKGKISSLNVFGILNALASLIVFLGLPLTIVSYFSAYGLGKLSNVYYKCQFPELHIDRTCFTMGSRIATMNMAHQQITSRAKNKWISEKELCKEFNDAIGEHEAMDSHEIAAMAEYIFGGLAKGKTGISRFDFVAGGMMNDVVAIEDMVHLFDADRKPHCLERLFKEDIGAGKDSILQRRGSSENEGSASVDNGSDNLAIDLSCEGESV
jgi:hypothetical protein